MELFGWLGFALLQVFYIPQTVKMVRSHNVAGLSLAAWVILWLGLFCYTAYSFWRRDLVFMFGNSLGLVQTSIQIGLILKYR